MKAFEVFSLYIKNKKWDVDLPHIIHCFLFVCFSFYVNQAGQIFKTISNHARIRLYTDSSRERNGFVLGWMSVAAIKPDPTTKRKKLL